MPRLPLPQAAPVPFPVGGVATADAYAEQRPGSTPDASNVRAFDTFQDRMRGGSRPGLSRYIDQRLPP